MDINIFFARTRAAYLPRQDKFINLATLGPSALASQGIEKESGR